MKNNITQNNYINTAEKHLRVHQTVKTITTLGPYRRYGLWVQGCTRNCPGCLTAEAQPTDGGYTVDINKLAEEIIGIEEIEGITVSGGEPYLQKNERALLLSAIREKRDLGVILYTGYRFNEIKTENLTGLCDVIIDGPYINELNDENGIRGSSNQNVIHITDRYRDFPFCSENLRRTEICETAKGDLIYVGVPTRSQIETINDIRAFFEK